MPAPPCQEVLAGVSAIKRSLEKVPVLLENPGQVLTLLEDFLSGLSAGERVLRSPCVAR